MMKPTIRLFALAISVVGLIAATHAGSPQLTGTQHLAAASVSSPAALLPMPPSPTPLPPDDPCVISHTPAQNSWTGVRAAYRLPIPPWPYPTPYPCAI